MVAALQPHLHFLSLITAEIPFCSLHYLLKTDVERKQTRCNLEKEKKKTRRQSGDLTFLKRERWKTHKLTGQTTAREAGF